MHLISTVYIGLMLMTLIGCGASENPIDTRVQPAHLTTNDSRSVFIDTYKQHLTNIVERQEDSPLFFVAEESVLAIDTPSVADQPALSTQPGDSVTATPPSFSTTNNQIQGVDELDAVKFDGQYLFTLLEKPETETELPNPSPIVSEPVVSSQLFAPVFLPRAWQIRILETTNGSPFAEEVATIDLSEQEQNNQYNGLYLHTNAELNKKSMLAIGSFFEYTFIYPPEVIDIPEEDIITLEEETLTTPLPEPEPLPIAIAEPIAADSALSIYPYPGPSTSQVVINSFDISTASTPVTLPSLKIEGQLVSTRKIGNKLYIISQTSALPQGFIPWATDKEQIQNNLALIEQLDIDALLPSYYKDDQELTQVKPTGCYMPPVAELYHHYSAPQLTTITQINLDNPDEITAACVFTGQQVFATLNNLYLFQNEWTKSNSNSNEYNFFTSIHKFELGGSVPQYIGSGRVQGEVTGRNPSFRLGEQNNHLGILTSEWVNNSNGRSSPMHRLTFLEPAPSSSSSFELDIVSQLPNDQRPEPIGKPNEQIHGVRFVKNRAYVVTFERIDPLYVINTNTVSDPFIEGSVELTGFSEYLHPLGENMLLGIGQETEVIEGRVRTQGLKLSLFDLSDPSKPTTIEEQVIGAAGTYSSVSDDHHAFSIITLDESATAFRFTLPISVYERPAGAPATTWGQWSYTGLHLFDVNLNNPEQKIALSGVINPNSDNNTRNYIWGIQRGVINQDTALYIQPQGTWGALWSAPDSAEGPL